MKLVLNGFDEDENFEEQEVSPEERRNKSLKMSLKNPLELFFKQSLIFSLS